MTAPVLTTERLVLRPHQVEDFADVAAMWSDAEVVRHISGVPSTDEASWSRLLRYIGHWQALNYGFWAVTDRASGAFLGEVGFADFRRDMTPPLTAPEAGWVLTRAAHGRGLATEAVACIHDWADRERDWAETVCIFDPDHLKSRNVAQKVGYQPAGEADFAGRVAAVMRRRANR